MSNIVTRKTPNFTIYTAHSRLIVRLQIKQMTCKYIIIDSDSQSSIILQSYIATLSEFQFSAYASNREEGINCILENNPEIIFLGTNTSESKVEIDLTLINELYKYMVVLPKIVVISSSKELAYDVMKHDIYDFILKPFQKIDVLKTLMKYRKEKSYLNTIDLTRLTSIKVAKTKVVPDLNNEEILESISNEVNTPLYNNGLDYGSSNGSQKQTVEVVYNLDTQKTQEQLVEIVKQSLESNRESTFVDVNENKEVPERKSILCIKSYGDYRFIEFDDIVYLKADNNSTDIILSNGDSITAFKTLKHFEESLPDEFMRIHNSHIINIKYVSRIHLGNTDCYLQKGKIKLPFSKSYKENINSIIELFTANNINED